MAIKTPFVLMLLYVTSCIAYSGPSGRYCAARSDPCCHNRRDSCSVPIAGTLCYCDEFCDHTAHHDDCCPDYRQVCRGEQPTTTTEVPPSTLEQVNCDYKGRKYKPSNRPVQQDCNQCTCVKVDEGRAEWSCDTKQCLNSQDLAYGINQPGSSWRAVVYPQFEGKTLADGLIYKLGTFPMNVSVINYRQDIEYPTEFDARREWPGIITPVVDQGWCGSDWAVSIAGVVGDRYSIQSMQRRNQRLSPQTLLSCNSRKQYGCKGGNLDIAFDYVRSEGLVREECFPYEGEVTECSDRGCERYKVGVPMSINREEDIMYDIMTSGPALAVMNVYQDFFHYKEGVYRHTRHGDQSQRRLHSVRIVGWGENDLDKYWIVANTWGPSWGENGYFRIARRYSGTDIESSVITVLPYV